MYQCHNGLKEFVLSCSSPVQLLWPHGVEATRLLCPWEFSRQRYWSGLPCPPPGDLPNLGIKTRSTALQADSLPSEPPGKFTRLQRLLDFFLRSSWSQKKMLSHFHLSTLSWCLVGCLPNGNFSHSERPYYILQVILFFLVSTLIYFSGLRVKSKVILSKIFIYLETEFYLTLKHMKHIIF